jgi:hypothetical protein
VVLRNEDHEYSGLRVVAVSKWGVAAFAQARVEKIIFVEPPLRLITQCELREIGERELTCSQDGWPRKIALNQGVTVWKGKDRNAGTLGPATDWMSSWDSTSRAAQWQLSFGRTS